MSNLMDRIGDEGTLDAVITRFHEKLIDDPLTSVFFVDVDTATLHRKQHWFLTMVFAGQALNIAEYMKDTHAALVHELGLSDVHFDHTIAHLQSALEESGVGADLVSEIIELTGALRNPILGRI